MRVLPCVAWRWSTLRDGDVTFPVANHLALRSQLLMKLMLAKFLRLMGKVPFSSFCRSCHSQHFMDGAPQLCLLVYKLHELVRCMCHVYHRIQPQP